MHVRSSAGEAVVTVLKGIFVSPAFSAVPGAQMPSVNVCRVNPMNGHFVTGSVHLFSGLFPGSS